MTDVRMLPVPDGLDGLRLDVALSRLFGLSRTAAAGLIDDGAVILDGSSPGRSEKVRGGSWLEISIPEPVDLAAAPPRAVDGLSILYSDDDIVAVDKPVGVAAHPSVGWTGPTVVGGLAAAGYRIATSGASERQGIVSRLDVGTSGLMVVAKSEYAYSVLKQAFRSRSVDKKYHALVQGLPDPVVGTIDAPIGRHPNHDYKFAVMEKGKPSVTHYEVIEAFRAVSLLDVHLETGRTHQIRVHFSALHHPCAGDLTYGADPRLAARLGLERQWLHAVGLGFDHPGTGKYVTYESPYPPDLAQALERL
jgi:23S rRNA pseudouridine1911/1915/1917 synthase